VRQRARLTNSPAESLPPAIFRLDSDLRYLYVSRAAAEDAGAPPAALLGRRIDEIGISNGDESLAGKCRRALSTSAEVRRYFTAQGRCYQTRIIPELTPDGRVESLLGITEDVTKHTLAEERLHHYQREYESLVNSIDAIVWEFDCLRGRFTFVSEQAEHLLGYPAERWIAEEGFWARQLHSEDRFRVMESWAAVSAMGERRELEYRMIAADGRIVWLRDLATTQRGVGQSGRLRGVMVDITARKREEALCTGQNRILEMIAQSAPLSEVLTELAHLFETQSTARCSVLLLDEDGVHVSGGIAPSLPDLYVPAVTGASIGPRAGSCGTAMYLRRPVIVADITQDPLWEDYRALAHALGLRACWSTPIVSKDDKVLGTFAMYCHLPRGPTPEEERLTRIATHLARIAIERQISETALRRSEERYRALVSATAQNVWRTDRHGNPLCLTSAWHHLNTVHPDDLERCRSAWEEALRDKSSFEQEFRIRNASGDCRTISTRAVPIFDGEQVREWVGADTDVTDRRRAEEAVRESEARSRAILKAIPDLMFVLTADGVYLEAHARSPHELLIPAEQLIGKSIWDVKPPALAAKFAHCFDLASSSDEPQVLEYDLQINGGVRHSEARVVRISDGRILVVVRNVTARRRAEEALRENQERMSIAQKAARFAIFDHDLQTGRDIWTPETEALYGLQPGEFEGVYEGWVRRLHPEDRERALAAMETAFSAGEYDLDFRIVRPDGSIRSLYTRAKVFYDDAGVPRRMLGVNVDVTERTQAEEALRRSEARYRNVVEMQTEMIFRCLPDARVTFVNEPYCRLVDKPRNDLIGRKFIEWIPESEHDEILKHLDLVMRDPSPPLFEHRFVAANGRTTWVQWTTSVIRDEGGKVVELQGIGRDVTERRVAERALRESEERFRLVALATRDAVYDWDVRTGAVWRNDAYQALYSPGEPVGTKSNWWEERIHPDDRRRVLAGISEAFQSGRRFWSDEYRFRRFDGCYANVVDRGYTLYGESGAAVRMIGAITDVTDAKLAEAALREREHELRRSHKQIRELAGRLLTAQEEERRRISRELHDDFNQRVAALSISLSRVRQRIPARDESTLSLLSATQERTNELADGIRSLSHRLHPATLEHAGLPAALKALITEWSRLEQIKVELSLSEGARVLPREVGLCLFRVAQESLRNIAKHASADRVEVVLSTDSDAARLAVRDWGCGFDSELARGGGGLGLVSMEERVRLMQGEVAIASAPGAGTEVLVTIPLAKE
jgi:PAS domain S-box-containing protein